MKDGEEDCRGNWRRKKTGVRNEINVLEERQEMGRDCLRLHVEVSGWWLCHVGRLRAVACAQHRIRDFRVVAHVHLLHALVVFPGGQVQGGPAPIKRRDWIPARPTVSGIGLVVGNPTCTGEVL